MNTHRYLVTEFLNNNFVGYNTGLLLNMETRISTEIEFYNYDEDYYELKYVPAAIVKGLILTLCSLVILLCPVAPLIGFLGTYFCRFLFLHVRFFVLSCACAIHAHPCPHLVLPLCALNALSSSLPNVS